MTIYQRVLAPKSIFFRRVQVGCFVLAFLCLAVLLSPFGKSYLLQQLAGCLYSAATAAALLCQVTTEGWKTKTRTHGKPFAKRK